MSDGGRRIGGWDVHTHIVPPAVAALAERGRFGMRAHADTLSVCGHGVPLLPISVASRLVERIHADDLDGAIVSVPPPLFRPDLAAADRREYADRVNDGLREACAPHAGRLRPLAYLPAEDPELAAGIATGLDAGWAGVVMGTQLASLSYASRAFDPLWETLGRLRLPLFIHPGATPDARLEPFYMSNLIGNPFETTLAAASLIMGGVHGRFPDLVIILAHGGGCAAALCGRWQRGLATRRAVGAEQALLPNEAMRRFYVDCLVHSRAYLAAIMDVVGEERVLLGSDWPFPMGAPSAEHDLGHLDGALRRKIRHTNAQRAFGARLLS
ncbi:MAG: amidohydrolase [Proteobacteria bacterium]|nr:amidohydrolase [Pseudomonadota bacterium]